MGNAHPYLVPSQEARELELSGGVRSLPQVPWWNADRRARDASRAAASADAVSCSVHLSAFRFLFSFLGLSGRDRAEHRFHRRFRHDAIGLRGTILAVASAKLGAHAPRERDSIFIAPVTGRGRERSEAGEGL